MTVRRESVRGQVRRALTERILSGHYQPGDRLVELQIARELGTSQGSVREALRELEASRLVESEPNRGTRVRVISSREEQEAYFVRGVLEEAAAPAATRALNGDVTVLREEVAAILAAAAAGNPACQAAHVYAFHRRVVEASGNAVLLRLWESLALETRVRLRLAWGDVNPEQVASSYQAILGALEGGDGAAVGRLLRAHAELFSPTDRAAADEARVVGP
jgi:DNA-binding GntR family transcriptional regulator